MEYKEIHKLKALLEVMEVPFEFRPIHDGYQICYPNSENRVCSAVQHYFSYGNDEDRIEIMGLLTEEEADFDEVVGYLTADDILHRICKHHRGE